LLVPQTGSTGFTVIVRSGPPPALDSHLMIVGDTRPHFKLIEKMCTEFDAALRVVVPHGNFCARRSAKQASRRFGSGDALRKPYFSGIVGTGVS
jgi:hypothetical protein